MRTEATSLISSIEMLGSRVNYFTPQWCKLTMILQIIEQPKIKNLFSRKLLIIV
eukprot:COSAG02_NODE_48528_length_333_cov_0.662393_1_plen_53_part_01